VIGALRNSLQLLPSPDRRRLDIDMPALLTWKYTAADAALIAMPALDVGGTDSGGWFAEVRELLLSWLPQAEDVTPGEPGLLRRGER
jgi:hypothetical protein